MKINPRPAMGIVGLRTVSDLMEGNTKAAQVIREDMPIELCRVPGILARHVDYTLSRARYPNERVAFVGALAFLSFAAGRAYRTQSGLYPNLYLVSVANSGAGKDEPRKVNNELARELGAAFNVEDKVASGEGLEDAIVKRAKVLLQYDEYDTLIRSIRGDSSGKMEYLVGVMLSMFTSAASFVKGRKKADSQNATAQGYCVHPHFTLYGSTIPEHLYKAFNERSMSNGFVARSLIVNCGTRPKMNPLSCYSDPPEDLLRDYYDILGCIQIDKGKVMLPDAPSEKRSFQRIVKYDQGGAGRFGALMGEWDDAYHALDEGDHAAEQSIVARRGEMTEKLAMLYAISADYRAPVMTERAVEWAAAFVTTVQGQMIEAARLYNAVDDFDDLCKRILRMFQRKKLVTKREMAHGLHRRIGDIDDAVETLTTAGELVDINGKCNAFKLPE